MAGEAALTTALLGVRQRSGIVVIIAHRASALATVDRLLVLNGGQIEDIGPRDEVLVRLKAKATAGTAKPVSKLVPIRPAGPVAKANGNGAHSARAANRNGRIIKTDASPTKATRRKAKSHVVH